MELGARRTTLEYVDGDIPRWVWRAGSAIACFTGRAGGVSSPPYESLNIGGHVGDDVNHVLENRRRVAAACDLDLDRVAATAQVHGADVWVDIAPSARSYPPAELRWSQVVGDVEADALVTASPGRGVMVATADCLPIAISWGEAIGVVHAGWRGLAAGVVEKAVAGLRGIAGAAAFTEAGRPHAVIGPALGRCCFEVGEDVAQHFDAEDVCRAHATRPHLDARSNARRRLERAGFVVESIDLCTRCEGGYFSHRGDGGETGRQALLAWRTAPADHAVE